MPGQRYDDLLALFDTAPLNRRYRVPFALLSELEADLRKTNLRGAGLLGAQFDAADLQEARLGGAFLAGASLRGADLRGAYLRLAKLDGADLSDANLEGAEGVTQVQLDLAHLDLGTKLPEGLTGVGDAEH